MICKAIFYHSGLKEQNNGKIWSCVCGVCSPVSPPSDSSEANTPRMLHSCWAPCFSVSLAPTPTHRKDSPGVTRTNASLEFRLEATASSCTNTDPNWQRQLHLTKRFSFYWQINILGTVLVAGWRCLKWTSVIMTIIAKKHVTRCNSVPHFHFFVSGQLWSYVAQKI